jgi:hypothetical protein
MKKKIVLSIAALTVAGLITGCGSSGGGSSNNTNNNATNNTNNNATNNNANQPAQKSVKVVDGYVIGANVCDANNICKTTEANGTATAAFSNTVLTATGGYIDVNGNNQLDTNDINLPNTFSLKTPAGVNVISPITDLIANGANPAKLAQVLGVSEADLYADPIATNNITLAKAIQIVYALKVENKETDFIKKINNFVTSNSSVQTDLPPMNKEINQPQQPKEENKTEASTDLPPMKVVTDLPPMGEESAAVSSTSQNNDQNNTQNNDTNNTTISGKGSLELFANLASSVASDTTKTLIAQVISENATNPIELEQKIANLKKELIKEATQIAENTTQNAENNASTAENTTQNAANNASTAENTTQNAENNETAQNSTAQATENQNNESAQSSENNTTQTENTQNSNINTPPALTDLPPM